MQHVAVERSPFPIRGRAMPVREGRIAASASPRIDLDGFNLALEEGTGVATYARNLHSCIQMIGGRAGILYGRRLGNAEALLQEMNFFDPPRRRQGIRSLRIATSSLWGQKADEIKLTGNVIFDDLKERFPSSAVFWNVDNLFSTAATYFDIFGRSLVVRVPRPPAIMHWTYPLPIRVAGTKNIYTLHDLVPLRLPHTTLDNKKRYLKLVRHLAQTGDHVVTVSESSKRDIINLLGVDESRVTNTYQSYDPGIEEDLDADAAGLLGFLGLERDKYFLFFGAVEPKKNVNRLLQAYLSIGSTTPLVIAGKNGWMHEKELRLLSLAGSGQQKNGLASWASPANGDISRVLRIEHLPTRTLRVLISNCRAVVFPSLYEGFGLPVLEAMALGAPVITSNSSSLPEIVGDAAVLVDPYNVRDLAAAIRKVDADANFRESLSSRGRARALQLFSQEAYASRVSAMYHSLGVLGV